MKLLVRNLGRLSIIDNNFGLKTEKYDCRFCFHSETTSREIQVRIKRSSITIMLILRAGCRSRRFWLESEFKTAMESEKNVRLRKKYKCICALYLGKTNYKYQLTGFAILGCLAAIYIYYIYIYIFKTYK